MDHKDREEKLTQDTMEENLPKPNRGGKDSQRLIRMNAIEPRSLSKFRIQKKMKNS